MKTKEEIYLDEINNARIQQGEKFASVLMSDAIRKFVMNVLIRYEDEIKNNPHT